MSKITERLSLTVLTQLGAEQRKVQPEPNYRQQIDHQFSSRFLKMLKDLLFFSVVRFFFMFSNCFSDVNLNEQSVIRRCLLGFEDEALCNLRRPEGQSVSSYLSNFNKVQFGREI